MLDVWEVLKEKIMYSKQQMLLDLDIIHNTKSSKYSRLAAYNRLKEHLSKEKQVSALLLPKKDK